MQGVFADYPLGITGPLNIRHTADGFILESAELSLGKGSLNARFRFGREDVMVDASFHGFPLEMSRLLGYPDLLGSAEGEIRLAGRPGRPDGTISFSVSDVRLKRPSARRIDPAYLAGKAVLEQGHIKAGLSIEGLSTKPITANLQAPLDFSLSPFMFSIPSQGEIQGQIRAETDLAAIPEIFLLEDQIIEGLMDIALSVTGTVEAPVLEGSLSISGGGYENTEIGTIVKDIQIRIKGEKETLVLEEARATDGQKGSISAKGWLRIFSLRAFESQVDLMLNDATLLRRFDLTANTNGHLTFSGEPKAFSLSGNLKIGPAEVHIPDRFPPEVTEMEVIEINRWGEETKPEERPKPDIYGRLNLDLLLDFPGRIFVRGRGLDSEWKGSLQITGNARDPLITGVLSVIRGHFNMFDKRFLLTSGAITFDGKAPPRPGIDVTAENRRSDLTARMRFSGNPSSLNLTLESDPILPQDEILARVLFGRSISETTPIQALRLAQALNALRGRGGVLDFMGRTRRFIGLDQLDIRQPEESGGETTVSIGKYLAEGVFVEMEKGVDTESSKVSVEVELTPNITIESESGSNSEGGVGLNWKWDY
jgi:translocation and assembly module TamB